ncbi:MAG: DUF2917 domain-containing protein [Gammaproteobacteria bacterium]|nr:DUF2917 domain-containing protein [Gammaproteobacteria bacterium]MBU0788433.1 DUF2917 domain-containing protein [Gammaproteobacteria bacterium]MBU0816411.1 DUF2917 domain-containing protein [Gammaproteobacteria bacterium]MBU1788048.1 DUF2917 domain-containing protein [Gammaproteobacteria bacterium]
MQMSLQNGRIHLSDGVPLRFQGARGVSIECTEGRLWLTVEGEFDDFHLTQGERLCIPNEGLVLVEGSPMGTIRLSREMSSASRWRQAVSQPLRDMGWSMMMVVSAFLRLLAGLAGYGEYLVAGRGRVLSRFEGNPP